MIGVFSAWQWLKREGIDRAQKEQDRRNALVEQAQALSREEDEDPSGRAAEFAEEEKDGEEKE